MSDFFFQAHSFVRIFQLQIYQKIIHSGKGVLFFWRAIRELLLRRQRESAKQALYKREDFLSCHVPL